MPASPAAPGVGSSRLPGPTHRRRQRSAPRTGRSRETPGWQTAIPDTRGTLFPKCRKKPPQSCAPGRRSRPGSPSPAPGDWPTRAARWPGIDRASRRESRAKRVIAAVCLPEGHFFIIRTPNWPSHPCEHLMAASENPSRDTLDSFWMPFTPNRQFKAQPRMLARASGMHYFTPEGRQILDGVAGLWCVNAGHGRSEITEAVARALATLDFAPTFQMAHAAAFEL